MRSHHKSSKGVLLKRTKQIYIDGLLSIIQKFKANANETIFQMTLIMIDGFVNVPLCVSVPLCGSPCSMIKRLKASDSFAKEILIPQIWQGYTQRTKVKVNICNNKNNAFLLVNSCVAVQKTWFCFQKGRAYLCAEDTYIVDMPILPYASLVFRDLESMACCMPWSFFSLSGICLSLEYNQSCKEAVNNLWQDPLKTLGVSNLRCSFLISNDMPENKRSIGSDDLKAQRLGQLNKQ